MQAMMYDATRKSVGVVYLWWFFLGGLSGHRFYTGKTGTAVAMLALTILGILLSTLGVALSCCSPWESEQSLMHS